MKIFEKLVHEQISTFIYQHDYLNERQSGFRKLFSTATTVVDVSDFIFTELDNKTFVCYVPFDTVDHKILLKKL